MLGPGKLWEADVPTQPPPLALPLTQPILSAQATTGPPGRRPGLTRSALLQRVQLQPTLRPHVQTTFPDF